MFESDRSAVTAELETLAETLARWVDDVPGVPAVYLFGSRVRGDHRPDSDVDLRLFLNEWSPVEATLTWWQEQNRTDFAAFKARLPGPLSLHREQSDDVDNKIREGSRNPVLVRRKVICVWTAPRCSDRRS